MSVFYELARGTGKQFAQWLMIACFQIIAFLIARPILAYISAEYAMEEITYRRIVAVVTLGILAILMLAYKAAGLAWKRLRADPKHSPIRPIREHRRSPVPQESIRLDDVIEILPNENTEGGRVSVTMFVMFALIIVLGGLASWGWIPIWGVLIGPIAFGLVLLHNHRERNVPLIRLDPSGLTSRRSETSVRTVFIPWSRIQTCELVGSQDVESGDYSILPVFYDAAGKRLHTPGHLAWATLDKAPKDRILGYLKARFPKLDIDPWEFK